MKSKPDPFTWFISLLGYLFLLAAIASSIHWLVGCRSQTWITRDRDYMLWHGAAPELRDGVYRPAQHQARQCLEPTDVMEMLGRDLSIGEIVRISP